MPLNMPFAMLYHGHAISWRGQYCQAIWHSMKAAGKAVQIRLHFWAPSLVAGSAMLFPVLRCGGRTVVQRAQQSGLSPSWSKHSVAAGRATAIAADLRSLHSLTLWRSAVSLHSRWYNLYWNCLCKQLETACPNNQSQASLLLALLMNYHAKTCNIVVDFSTNSIKNTSCKSLCNILPFLLLRKNSLPNLKGTGLCTLLQSIRIYKVYHSKLNDWFWYFSQLSLNFRFMK